MATPISRSDESRRVQARRRATIEEALDHAEAITCEQGAGAVTVSEIARRLGMRAPSVYKYFPSLHAIYDGLFERGNSQLALYVDDAVLSAEPGLDRLLVASRAMMRWASLRPGLATLMYWRPVPGFEPTPESFAPSQAMWQRFRADLAVAVKSGALSPAADTDQALRMLTIMLAGISSQQMANEPAASFEDGRFTALIDPTLDMFVQYFAPKTAKAAQTPKAPKIPKAAQPPTRRKAIS